ncbi:MAG: rhomboid family intramembrane serine protease [Pseudomonadota bacterium]
MERPQNPRQIRLSFGGSLTPVVRALLWINGLVYLFLLIAKGHQISNLVSAPMDTQALLIQLLGLVPKSVTHDWALWQPVTYMFVHQAFWHLLLNMLGLWWFGADVERYMGGRSFLRYYLLCGIGGALAAIVIGPDSGMVTIGASGAVFGLLVAYGFLFPNRVIYLYFLIPIRAIWCVAIFCAITLYALWTGGGGGVSHIAHLGGMVVGVIWSLLTRYGVGLRSLMRGMRKRRLRRRFRLIRRDGDEQDPSDGYTNRTIH